MENAKTESYRDQVVRTTKQFKTSWVELGEFLTKVATEKLYIEWSFSSFEEYCKVELRLKKSTAIKLTNAYFFITKDVPDLKEKELDLESVSALLSIKKDDSCTPEIFSDMMDLTTKGKSPATVKKNFKLVTYEEPESKTQKFFKESSKLAKRLLQRIKPVDTIQPRYKETLGEMVSSFDAEANSTD